jgi:hypothetical protein
MRPKRADDFENLRGTGKLLQCLVTLARRTSFDLVRRFTVLRLRALASLLLALERRRIAHPKAWDYADFQSTITAGICARRNGLQ